MKKHTQRKSIGGDSALDRRLAAYLAAVGATAIASTAEAAVVGSSAVQPFGINGDVNIDFNKDGQIDFQIDHDRVDLGGGNLVDYLQLDKNDVNSAANPLPIDGAVTFPLGVGPANDEVAYMMNAAAIGSYPAALPAGAQIGPAQNALFDFQEGTNFNSTGKTIRANRLIDEDNTQVDQTLGGLTAAQVHSPTNGPNFLGLGGEVRYLGVRVDLNNAAALHYGWIGIRIDNEADATGAVVGYGYETTANTPIRAGQVPEPGTIVSAAIGAVSLAAAALVRRRRRRNSEVARP